MIKYQWDEEEEITNLLMWRTVTKIADNKVELDNGTILAFVGNADCCMVYELVSLGETDNIITKVEFRGGYEDEGGDGIFEIFVFAAYEKINLARFEGSDGTGDYGTGYTILVQLFEE